MIRGMATLVAVLVTGPAAWAGEMAPPSEDRPGSPGISPALPQAPAAKEKNVEGKIERIDGVGSWVTLEDGTTLTIPNSLNAARSALRKGALVKAAYEERGGEKVVTMIQVELPRNPSRRPSR